MTYCEVMYLIDSGTYAKSLRSPDLHTVTNQGCRTEVATDPEWPSRLWQDSGFFFWIRSQTFVKNRTRSHFLFSAVAGVCVVFIDINS